jgi:hypothetical protein
MASPDLLAVVLETTSEVIFEEESQSANTIKERYALWTEYLSLRSRALGLDFLSSWLREEGDDRTGSSSTA